MRMRIRILPGVLVLTIGILGLALAAPASAAAVTRTWVGNSGWWNNGSNWNPVGQPEDGDTVDLTQSDTTDRTIRYDNNLYPNAVLYSLGINSWGSGTGTITLWQERDSLSAIDEYIGGYNIGTFTQSGGTNTSSDSLYLGTYTGTGTYNLSGTGNLSAGYESIGDGGTGTFTQSGGTNTIGTVLYLGYNTTGNGTYNLSGGILSAGYEYIGGYGNGSFTQSGGTSTISTELHLGTYIGNDTYNLSGTGSLSAGYEYIGDYGNGFFTQSGGSNTISTDLYLGHNSTANGTYSISTGNLEAKNFYVGGDGKGTLKITDPTANITVSNKLSFGPHSTFTSVPGTTIHMTGSAFENKSTDPTALTGLSNLELVFEGGNVDIDPFEVAGKDLGAVMAGFDNNFALGTLTLGGTDIGNIKLSDLFDNQSGWTGNEALYVYNLNIGAGSDLNLNGLNLYYLNGSINGNANIFGGSLTPIPEPSTLLLLGSGLLGLMRLRKKKSVG